MARRHAAVCVRARRRDSHGRGSRSGVGEAPGPHPADDPHDHRRGDVAVPDRAGPAPHRVARAPDGGVLAQLERHRGLRDRRHRDGAARHQGQGPRRARGRAARRLRSRRGRDGGIPLHRRARGQRAEGGGVRRRRLHRAEAQGRARFRRGSRHDRRDSRPRRHGRQAPDRRQHDLERSRRDQVDPGPRALRPAVRGAARARLRRRRDWPRFGAPSASRSPPTRGARASARRSS